MSGYAQQAESGQAQAGAFDRSQRLFEEVVSGLADPGCGELTHAQLEDQLTERSRELMRSLFQDHWDLRASREQRRSEGVPGAEGVVRARAERGHQRELTTVFGTVRVTRIAYRAPNVANLYPADAVLNLPAGRHSHGLRRLAAIEAARGSFEQAAVVVERASGVRVGKRQLEALAGAAVADVAGFYAQRPPSACSDADLLVLTCDGKGIVMRPEALRETTAKAARTTGHKLATRLSPGEKHGRKRMAELAGVYDATPAPRAPADVISRPGQPRPPHPDPAPAASGSPPASPTTSRPSSPRQRELRRKLERGVIRWPGKLYREAFRAILGGTTDAALGFVNGRRAAVKLENVNRRQSLHTALGVGAMALGGPLAALLEGTQPTPIPRRVGATDIEQIRAASRGFSSWDFTYGGGLTRDAALAQLRWSAQLLDAICPDRLRPELFSTVGDLAETAGYISFDAYAHEDARRILSFALACAEQADDWHLRAAVLSSTTAQAIRTGPSG